MYINFLIVLEVICHDTSVQGQSTYNYEKLMHCLVLLLIACHSCISFKYKNYTKQCTQLYTHIY